MNIRNTRELKQFAAQRLEGNQAYRPIVLLYTLLALGTSALVTGANYGIGLAMDNFGGLRHVSTRTILSAIQNTLPILQNLFGMCLELGLLAAMLRLARGQYVSRNTLKLGFDRFWVLMRCAIIKSLILWAEVFLGVYLGIMVYMMTPFSDAAVELLLPYMEDLTVLSSELVLTEAVSLELTKALTPAFVICGIFICLFAIPMLYNYRMSSYVIIDKPALGALAALRESKKMMRGNRRYLLKLDLGQWWYYLAIAAASVVGYGDMILPMLGVQLPGNAMIWYFVFYALYLAVILAIYYLLRSRVEVAYALAYDAVRPEEKQDTGVVLGNIFQM